MKRKSLLLLAVLLIFPISEVLGQITISRQTYESARGKTMVSTSYYMEENLPIETLNTIIAQAGANKSFNFSGIVFPSTPDQVIRSRTNNLGESHPFQDEPSLAEANFNTRVEIAGVPDTVAWSFLKLEDTKVTILGSGTIIESTGEKEYVDLVEQFGGFFDPLPQTYQTEWVEELTVSAEGFELVTKIYTYIDAWGTLTVPGGRSASALRLRTETQTIINIPGFPMPEEPPMLSGYTYITNAGISASIDVELDPETEEYFPIAVYYSVDGGEFTSSIGRDKVDLPEGFSLSQNYPNPFNPTTTIDFSLPFTADATIRVYDLTGRVVSTIRLPGTTAGTHSVQFDATNLSSGVYLYRLDAGGYSTAKTFTLVK